jgi:hypothetical protein
MTWNNGMIGTLREQGIAALRSGISGAARALVRVLRHPTAISLVLPEARMADEPKRGAAAVFVCAIVCGLLLFRMFDVGLQRSMDGTAFEAIEDCTSAVAVAISDLVYGLNKGYVAYSAVKNALISGGMTKDENIAKNLGKPFPANLRDRALLNNAIVAAMGVVVPRPDQASFADRSLSSMTFADVGLADYDKLAFMVFGFRIEALYYCYFLLLAIATTAFILAHRNSVPSLAVLVAFLSAGNLIISLNIFDDINVATVANSRFLSTLGILPGLHLILLMLERHRPTSGPIVLAVVQVAVFSLALSARSSIAWLAFLLVGLALLQFAIGLCWFRVESVQDAWFHSKLLVRRGLWAAAIFMVGVSGHNVYLSYKLHPTYALDDFIPHHLRYHNAFLGLRWYPQWYAVYAKDYQLADSDELGFAAGIQYFTSHYDAPASYYVSPLTGGIKFRLHDRMVLGAYLSFVRQHPLVAIQAHIEKLRQTATMISEYTGRALASRDAAPALLTAVLGTLVLVSIGLIGRRRSATPYIIEIVARPLALMIAITLFSWLPSLYAYPAVHVIADQLWIGMFAFLMGCWSIITFSALTIIRPGLRLLNRGVTGAISGNRG